MKDFAGSLVMVFLTMVIVIGSYGAATHGAGQRVAIDDLRRQLATETREIRDLEAELRTRARLPQLERWNEQVLKMSAPTVGQFMGSPVQLINLVTPPAPASPSLDAPVLRLTVAPDVAREAGDVVRTALQGDGARAPALVRASFESAADTADWSEGLEKAKLDQP